MFSLDRNYFVMMFFFLIYGGSQTILSCVTGYSPFKTQPYHCQDTLAIAACPAVKLRHVRLQTVLLSKVTGRIGSYRSQL